MKMIKKKKCPLASQKNVKTNPVISELKLQMVLLSDGEYKGSYENTGSFG
jgi:hypothetical protein